MSRPFSIVLIGTGLGRACQFEKAFADKLEWELGFFARSELGDFQFEKARIERSYPAKTLVLFWFGILLYPAFPNRKIVIVNQNFNSSMSIHSMNSFIWLLNVSSTIARFKDEAPIVSEHPPVKKQLSTGRKKQASAPTSLPPYTPLLTQLNLFKNG